MPKKKFSLGSFGLKKSAELKAHSKAKTPMVQVAKAMKRTELAVRQRAKTIGTGGHRR